MRKNPQGPQPELALKQLECCLRKKESRLLQKVVSELDRMGCWNEVLPFLRSLSNNNHELGAGLLWAWQSYGFHLGSSLRGSRELVQTLRAACL